MSVSHDTTVFLLSIYCSYGLFSSTTYSIIKIETAVTPCYLNTEPSMKVIFHSFELNYRSLQRLTCEIKSFAWHTAKPCEKAFICLLMRQILSTKSYHVLSLVEIISTESLITFCFSITCSSLNYCMIVILCNP